MHAPARLALFFALGLFCGLSAAESLPPLRVDPALLGGVPAARPTPPASPPAAEVKPVQVAPVAQPAPEKEETSAIRPVAAPVAPEGKPEVSAASAAVDKVDKVEKVEKAEKVEQTKASAVAAGPGARAEAPATATAAEVRPLPPQAPQIVQPPQVAEQPTLPPLYSAHADAGRVPLPAQAGQEAAPSTFISASRIDGRDDNEFVAQGEAELRKGSKTLTADRLTYWRVEDEMEAEGNVRYVDEGESITGPKLRLNLTDHTGRFEQPKFSISREAKPARGKAVMPGGATATGAAVREKRLTTASGKADLIAFQDENRMRLTNATYSTCKANDPDWYAKVAQLDLDYDNEVGEARDAQVVFKGVPLFYSPWLSFSLNNRRKSGFLAPTFGTSSKSGIEFSLPYYWDIAPNMDATITPRLMSKRGLQINTEYRYLNHDYQGRAQIEWLPNDRLADRRRYGYSLLHLHNNLGAGFSGLLNINGVSDSTYIRDLSTRITQAAQGNLLRQGILNYGGWLGSVSVNFQSYQTLQDPDLPPVVKPYQRLPQITVVSSRPEFFGGTAFAFNGEYVNFDHPTLDTAKRLTLYPQLSLPLQTPAWHVIPKIGLHATRYDIRRRTSTGPDSIVRNLPIFSVDAGLAYERDLSWFGKSLTQTLEPRLYYLLVPQRTQKDIPIFDSGRTDFNFATIFSDNIYSGVDRIADANQITAALTSRLIDPQSGEEYVRGLIGQRYYFAKQNVTLPGESSRPGGASDFLAALSGRLLPQTYADVAWQYNPREGETERFSMAGRWQPDFAKVLNASYRYTRDKTLVGGTPGIRQVDLSAQWPLSRGWYGVGRFNYSLRERKLIETIGGLEYNGGCWVGRLVLQKYATASGDTNTALFVQLELNDFSKIGSNPLELLARRIPGYGQINQATSDPVFGYQ